MIPWNKGKTKKDFPQLSNAGVKKSNSPWNKGLKTGLVPKTAFKKGHIVSEERKLELSQLMSGEKHFMWKGNKVGYSGIHMRIRSQKGPAKKCSECGSAKKVQWANKSHTYKPDINDFFELCYSCHKKYDANRNDRVKYFDEGGRRILYA